MSRIKSLAAAALLSVTYPVAAQASECRALSHDGADFTICEIDAGQEVIRLFHSTADGEALGSFPRVDQMLRDRGERLGVAMNAGMYHNDLAPVGLYVEDGQQAMRLITSDGPGNFGLLPNGVFCIREGRADVIESLAFEAAAPACRYATQSGPMLVIDGALHPRFLPDSDSVHIRNGVGTSADGQRVVLAISEDRVNFHTFGTLFRDALKLPNALYFDGKVSRLYAPGAGRHDRGFPMGPIVGVVKTVQD
ncbi:phosphodiester glycosidase family protein [Roseovarius sp. C7]|uniref:phosphodiester glycosidase family protein n=1 Tax=Roseovarius sp. C7 TaxID=3398643 RepID=UPI0039F722BA